MHSQVTRASTLMNTLTDAFTKKILEFTGSQRFLTIQLDITNACNLKCLHCYHPHHKNEGALPFDGWQKILDQYSLLLKKLYLKPAVTLCGGEPMTSPLLKPMLIELSDRWPGIQILILTNGTVMRKDLMPLFQSLNVRFQVSLDGPDSKRHDEIRGSGSFEKSLHGIREFTDSGLEVSLLGILSRKTSAWIEDFFDLAETIRVSSMNFTRFIPEGYGESLFSSGQDRPLGPFELKSAMKSILDHSIRTGVRTNTTQPLFHLIDDKLGRQGMAGFQGLIVDYKGNLKFSSRASFALGNILEKGLENLFLHHPLMKSLRSGDIEGCGGCEFYTRCGGNRTAAYAATGSFLAPDPGCWLLEEEKQRRVV